MSVLVKGLEMPENCIGCPMQYGGWCYVAPDEIDERVAPTVAEAWEQGKPDWCPLVEVPTPHGRLIDVDALAYSRVRIAHEDGTIGGYNAVVMSSEIKHAPTVIEEEEC